MRILIVEDEPLTRASLARALLSEGHSVRQASDAAACRACLLQAPADLILLDLGLPGEDGLSLARELSARGDLDIIVVTARAAPESQIKALDLGADDYLVKPVHIGELAARIRARERRRAPQAQTHKIGDLQLDHGARALFDGAGSEIPLSRGEYEILTQLAAAAGKIVSREALSLSISRTEDSDLRSVDALISRLRRKLGRRELIMTAPGFGYRLGSEP